MPEHEPLAAELRIVASVDAPEPSRSEAEEPIGSAKLRNDAKDPELYEEKPVLDVHLPHSTHTWKDFWIHLGTITAGLLIAISLEQSVEALHRAHVRHELEADLREEGFKEQSIAELNMRFADEEMATTAAQVREVESTLAIRHHATPPFPPSSFVPPPRTTSGSYGLTYSVWATAKDGGLLVLLPVEQARAYSRLYRAAEQINEFYQTAVDYRTDAAAYGCRFSSGTLPCHADLWRMNDDQLDEYARLLTRYFMQMRATKQRILNFIGKDKGLLAGTPVPDGDLTFFWKEVAEHPDVFLLPLPESKGAK